MGLKHDTAKSFGYAFEGIKTALKREPNFRIHIIIAILALTFALFIGFTRIEWIVLLFAISFVLILELINTSLEALVNIVGPEVMEEAKAAKDVSAAAVLISAILAFLVGLILFLPKIYLLFYG